MYIIIPPQQAGETLMKEALGKEQQEEVLKASKVETNIARSNAILFKEYHH